MRWGVCSSPDTAEELARLGWDYVEWSLRAVAALDEPSYAELRALARRLPIRVEAFNGMLPRGLKVTGPDTDHAALRAYLARAYPRAAELGGAVIVFGSGDARTLPDGWPRERGLEQFGEACRIAGDAAARHGMLVAIEPLNPRETNLVTTVAEAVAVAHVAAHPTVRVLSDLYHVEAGGEGLDGTISAAAVLAHVHIATPEERGMPLPERGAASLARFFAALRRAGYDGRVSVEGSWTVEEAAGGLAHLRAAWEGAS